MTNKEVTKRLNYHPSKYLVTNVELDFTIKEKFVIVKSRLHLTQNGDDNNLFLDGTDLELQELLLDGKPIPDNQFANDDSGLSLKNLPAQCIIETTCKIDPYNNTSLMGLYKSGAILCSQNEAEGFRRITYYLDRPDVMATFTTTIRADKRRYPVLLSNGNKLEERDLDDNMHEVKWHDPFPKPCYLFAIVAGDLGVITDKFMTMNDREIALQIYVDRGNEDRANFAMQSLKKAMVWDEETFGLEYDLDLFMIVAVDAFTAGAMENKGLNIFNSRYVLADKDSATDADFMAIEAVIGHEYFHNWTGNRVTCRDWFQLTLKEGLTVFRDQEFSSDMNSRSVKRIADVLTLREHQFPEDAGPNKHSIRPNSYLEIDNFYTATVYEKGAEVIRMLECLVGQDKFREGISKYFELYDGQAVTCEDFIHAMELSSGLDLQQFRLWYETAGTPNCHIVSNYDKKGQTYTLNIKQDSANSAPLLFPLTIGLIDDAGNDIPLHSANSAVHGDTLHISKTNESFIFNNISKEPKLSLLRNFSAPIKLDYDYSLADLTYLFANDNDPFARYEAGQRLAISSLADLLTAMQKEAMVTISPKILNAFGVLLDDAEQDCAFVARAMALPSIDAIAEKLECYDYKMIFDAREFFLKALALKHEQKFVEIFLGYQNSKKDIDNGRLMAERELRNMALAYLLELGNDYNGFAYEQFNRADNMTDRIAALKGLVDNDCIESVPALRDFYDAWQDNFNVITKWFAIQASANGDDVYDKVLELEKNPLFDLNNPNKVRSLLGVFARNSVQFHHKSGRGYKLIAARIIELDSINPSVAAGLARSFINYAKLDKARQTIIKRELENILQKENLSKGVYEIVSNTLKL